MAARKIATRETGAGQTGAEESPGSVLARRQTTGVWESATEAMTTGDVAGAAIGAALGAQVDGVGLVLLAPTQ